MSYKLYAVRIFTANWERSLAFYRDSVGLPLAYSEPGMGWAQFRPWRQLYRSGTV